MSGLGDGETRSVHFVGVGGVGMGTLARTLSESGIRVTGSDGKLYEPMKGVLERANIQLEVGFHAKAPEKFNPDLVVIGNVVRKDNPEARAWIQSGKPFMSFPDAVRKFLIRDKYSIVCAGTHGKSTSTTWIAYLLDKLGADPSYLIGAVPNDLAHGCAIRAGKHFVGEGDEYDSAFFDKGPKFFHYNPSCLVLTSIEFDHADIYRDLDHVKAQFEKLVAMLPGHGLCIARYEDPVVMEVVTDALCPVQTFGLAEGAMWTVREVNETEDGFEFDVCYKGRSLGRFQTPLFGDFNLMNLVSGICCAANLGFPIDSIRPIVSQFRGVRRRQQTLIKRPIHLIDDFAHHPTEVKNTLDAVKRRFAGKRVWALFEPRSATARRNTHQQNYVEAFDSADQVLIASAYNSAAIESSEKFSAETLVSELENRGKSAKQCDGAEQILEYFLHHHSPGDVVVVMSNGEFGKIQQKLIDALES